MCIEKEEKELGAAAVGEDIVVVVVVALPPTLSEKREGGERTGLGGGCVLVVELGVWAVVSLSLTVEWRGGRRRRRWVVKPPFSPPLAAAAAAAIYTVPPVPLSATSQQRAGLDSLTHSPLSLYFLSRRLSVSLCVCVCVCYPSCEKKTDSQKYDDDDDEIKNCTTSVSSVRSVPSPGELVDVSVSSSVRPLVLSRVFFIID